MTKDVIQIVEDLNSQFYQNLEGYEFTFNPFIYKFDGYEEWIQFMGINVWQDGEWDGIESIRVHIYDDTRKVLNLLNRGMKGI
jgi:hypothetical protein